MRGIRSSLLLVVFAVLLSACGLSRPAATPGPSERDPLAPLIETFSSEQTAEFIGQPFPAAATRVHVAGEAALDTMVIARFDLPTAELDAYLAALGLTEPLEPGHSPFFSADPPYPEAREWWSPPVDGDSGDFSGLYQQVGDKHYKIVVVSPAPEQMTVYLQVYNT